MKDIAKACGVSVATVSKSLNDHSDIGTETKKRIRETAREMGYFPNSSARCLKTNRSYNLGVLFVDEARSGLTHNYFSNVLNSIKQTAEAAGYDLTFLNGSKQRRDGMSYLEHCKYRGLDGVIIACVNFDDPEVIELTRSGIPVVTIDHIFNDCCAVVSNNARGIGDLLSYVHSMGHHKVAYIHSDDRSAVTKSRISSFYIGIEQFGMYSPDEYEREAAYLDTEQAAKETLALLSLPNPPTCIFYPDDFSCFGGINAIRTRGLRIPQDISVVGYDGLSYAKYIEPQITTLEQDTEQLGRLATQKLIDLIEKPRTTLIEMLVVEGKVYAGKTVAKLN